MTSKNVSSSYDIEKLKTLISEDKALHAMLETIKPALISSRTCALPSGKKIKLMVKSTKTKLSIKGQVEDEKKASFKADYLPSQYDEDTLSYLKSTILHGDIEI